jgi:hypothetical protein
MSSNKVPFTKQEENKSSKNIIRTEKETPNKPSRNSSIIYSESFSTPLNKLKESLHTAAVENTKLKVPEKMKTSNLPTPASFTSPGF